MPLSVRRYVDERLRVRHDVVIMREPMLVEMRRTTMTSKARRALPLAAFALVLLCAACGDSHETDVPRARPASVRT